MATFNFPTNSAPYQSSATAAGTNSSQSHEGCAPRPIQHTVSYRDVTCMSQECMAEFPRIIVGAISPCL